MERRASPPVGRKARQISPAINHVRTPSCCHSAMPERSFHTCRFDKRNVCQSSHSYAGAVRDTCVTLGQALRSALRSTPE